MTTTIWHNPRCSKSRQTLALLEEKGIKPSIRDYIADVPGADEIAEVLSILRIEPRALMRTKDALYKELGLADEQDNDALIKAMVSNSKLIERPVVIHHGKVRLGRPPESILEIL